MDISSEHNHFIDLRAKILASPAYKERCALLFDLFQASREAGRDPNRILSIQIVLVELLLLFQTKQSEFKNENNEIGVAIAKHLILILKQIADSIVWRALGYDRVLIQLLAEHHSTGYLDDTVFSDFATAQQIVEQEGAIVIINDLTTILRHGDLTVIGKNQMSVLEIKYGKASANNCRAIRQRKNLNELINFLNKGVRIVENRRDFIFMVDVPPKTYESIAAEVINQARQHGYYHAMVSDCLAIEAIWLKNQKGEYPQKRPFNGVEHIMRSHNLDVFKPKSRIAPYGIYRFDNQSCFDLISGNILLATTLNFDNLQKRYKLFGLSLELPQPSQQEVKKYQSVPMAERKKLMNSCKFVVRDGKNWISKTPDFFYRIGLELLCEDSFIQADRQLMNYVINVDLPDKNARFYIGYKNEREIWI